jgi:hypothetical protein
MIHYDAICAVAKQLGWPVHFRTDLDADKTMCEQHDACRQFGWTIRETGTHLIYVDTEFDRDWAEAIASQHDRRQEQFYWWDGRKLLDCTPQGWIERIRDQPLHMFQYHVAHSFPWGRPEHSYHVVKAFSKDIADRVAKWAVEHRWCRRGANTVLSS